MTATMRIVVAVAVCAVLAAPSVVAAELAGTAFTYQGQLKQGGVPVTASCDFQFSLYDAAGSGSPPSGGNQVGATQTLSNVDVDNGLFSVELNDVGQFGPGAFNGEARWVQIAVRVPHDPNDVEPYTTLDPRQELTPTPYALALPGLRTEQDPDSPNVIGGYVGNRAGAGVMGAAIGGGGTFDPNDPNAFNRVTDDYGTVGGGVGNQAGNDSGTGSWYATVGGGHQNAATAAWATVAGGAGNVAESWFASVAGGNHNTAGSLLATVGGGGGNVADGYAGTVPGGAYNAASGDYSFAAGRTAKASHDGTFVWADSTDADFVSTGIDQFLVRASGGVGINTNDPNSMLTVNGVIESLTGGFKFPDGTTQITAGGGGLGGSGTANTIAKFADASTLTDSVIHESAGKIGVGVTDPGQKLSVDGVVQSASGGFLFPDGKLQPAVGWTQYGNSGLDPNSDVFLGTIDNTPLDVRVNNVRALRIEPDPNCPTLIGGFAGNSVTSGARGATIGGGGDGGAANRVTDRFGTVAGGSGNLAGNDGGTPFDAEHATVGGGVDNVASHDYATVAGGDRNTASSFCAAVGGGFSNIASGEYATVPGGWNNWATADYSTIGGGYGSVADGNYATVAGGYNNVATGVGAAVGGGWNNTASGGNSVVVGGESNNAGGLAATVAGGRTNDATGEWSFAAGYRAKADQDGSFVWADYKKFDIHAMAANSFTVRCTGGARFVSAIDGSGAPTAGVVLNAGGVGWSPICDRNLKENIEQVDGRDVLERLATMPIATWNAKAQDPGIRHIGPMAQDFKAAFGVGESERRICTVDADGVALAAIQGLHEIVQEKDAKIAAQAKQIADLTARLAAIEGALTERTSSGKAGAK